MMDNKTCRVDILSVSLGDPFRLMRRTRTESHGCRQS